MFAILHVGKNDVSHLALDLPLALFFLYFGVEGGLLSEWVELYLIVALRDNSKLPVFWRHFFENCCIKVVQGESFYNPKVTHAHC